VDESNRHPALRSDSSPDRVADLGVELRKIADKKMKELNAVYEEGLRARGTAQSGCYDDARARLSMSALGQ
jgi:hypothetical protein